MNDTSKVKYVSDFPVADKEIQVKKRELRDSIAKKLGELSESEFAEKIKKIENRLFDFANFVESKIPLLYVNYGSEVATWGIIKQCHKT